ncbi:MAG TPA: hypothetical protein VM115_14870 [Vicinamibacterales bacterium]|nr:hypothetical protein [Vicinamibacterales bacterium]
MINARSNLCIATTNATIAGVHVEIDAIDGRQRAKALGQSSRVDEGRLG